ncbi:NAC domain-containing protein 72-like [Papaver somniferum]|uniref:NAC domain-containing protein 72-like n=1 Tax=Papaver somniferum TaxID=3469 RepID=UPI000E6F93FA|nr:NAC domain-containing protein 72-like [Papaver somniferum]
MEKVDLKGKRKIEDVYESQDVPRHHCLGNCNHDVPAVQFAPPDPKLLSMYLKPKIDNPEIKFELMPCIPDVDVYKYHPEKLLEKYQQKPAYFYTKRTMKYPNGKRPNRNVKGRGYWRMITKTEPVMAGNTEVGEKSGLVFHTGRREDCKRITETNWLMEEYHIPGSDWTLCWIYLNI